MALHVVYQGVIIYAGFETTFGVAEVRCWDNSEQGALVCQPLLIAEPWEQGLVSGVAL